MRMLCGIEPFYQLYDVFFRHGNASRCTVIFASLDVHEYGAAFPFYDGIHVVVDDDGIIIQIIVTVQLFVDFVVLVFPLAVVDDRVVFVACGVADPYMVLPDFHEIQMGC